MRRLLRFKLRTLLVLLTVTAVWLGMHMRSVQRQRAAIRALYDLGAPLEYDYQVAAEGSGQRAESWVPPWLLAFLGPDHFHVVKKVSLMVPGRRLERIGGRRRETALAPILELPQLEQLLLLGPGFTDDDLEIIAQARSLKQLRLFEATTITDRNLLHLKQLEALERLHLENCRVTDASAKVFAALPSLEHLIVLSPHLSRTGCNKIESLPNLKTVQAGRSLAYIN